jgi:Tfp pilus assembly protein PilV
MWARLHKDESGYSLTELLMAMIIGLIILFAAFLLLDTANSTSAKIADRQDAVQRGRAAMEILTRQIRSQVCLNETAPISYGDPDTITFYADMADGTKNVERRRITYDAATQTVTEDVYPGAGLYPDLTFPAAPTDTRVLLRKVDRAKSGATPVAFLRYFGFDAAGVPGAMKQLPTPLTVANTRLVVMVKVAFNALPDTTRPNDRDSSSFYNDVYVRLANPTAPTTGPRCL